MNAAIADEQEIQKEVKAFQEGNPDKQLNRDLKRRSDEAAQLIADLQKQIAYFEGKEQWLVDNFPEGTYRDVIGLCKAASIEEIREQDYSLNPGRYVGVSFDVEDLDDFRESMSDLKAELSALNDKSAELMESIMSNLNQLGI